MEYDPPDPPPFAASAFSAVDIAADEVDDLEFDEAGDDILVDDETVIVTDETVIVTDDIVIVAEETATASGAAADSPAAVGPAADSEMAASEIEMALEEIERELAEVERALERLGDGSYGRCQTCGGVLSDEELETAPASRFCSAHLAFEGG